MYVSNLLSFFVFCFFFDEVDCSSFLFDQTCQLAGQLRVTLIGFNR